MLEDSPIDDAPSSVLRDRKIKLERSKGDNVEKTESEYKNHNYYKETLKILIGKTFNCQKISISKFASLRNFILLKFVYIINFKNYLQTA